MDGQYWKGDRTMSTNEWLLTSDFWQFLEPWHGRWYENEIFIASCTDNIYDLENERWLLGTWLIMLGFMDLWWPRVCRHSTSVLLKFVSQIRVFTCVLCRSNPQTYHWSLLKIGIAHSPGFTVLLKPSMPDVYTIYLIWWYKHISLWHGQV